MPDGLYTHIREENWGKNQSQPELKKHILDELKQLQNLVDGYATALENHPHAKHENQLIYIRRYINRMLYSVTTYY
jgi:hypothetical protein